MFLQHNFSKAGFSLRVQWFCDGSFMLSVFLVCRFDEESGRVAGGGFDRQSVSGTPELEDTVEVARRSEAQSNEVLKFPRNQKAKGQDGVTRDLIGV
jgi:hypothetical protein